MKRLSGYLEELRQADLRPGILIAALFVYAFLRNPILQLLDLEESAFVGGWPILSLVLNPFGFALVAALLVAPFLDKKWNWSFLPKEKRKGIDLRIFLLAIAAAFVWTYSLGEFNYYFNFWFFLERILILAFAIALWWSPKVLGVLYIIVILSAAQFNHPFAAADSDRQIIQDLFLLVLVYFLVTAFQERKRQEIYLLLLLHWASFYFTAGLFKLSIGDTFSWITENDLGMFVRNSLVHGLFPLPNSWNEPLARALSPISPWLAALVVLLECSVVLALFKRSYLGVLLFLFPALHLLLYLVSGYLYWQWAFITVLVVGLVRKEALNLQRARNVVIAFSVVIVVFGHWIFHTPRVAWYDLAFADYYYYEVELESGEVYEVSPSFFSRYDLPYAWEEHHSLGAGKHLQVLLGGTFYDLSELRALRRPTNTGYLKQLEAAYGVQHQNYVGAEKLKNFFRRYLRNYNANPQRAFAFWTWIDAPKGMNYVKRNFLRRPERIRRITLKNCKTYFDGREFQPFSQALSWSEEILF